MQAYYDELLSGKTGRHDLKIKELKEKYVYILVACMLLIYVATIILVYS